LGITATLSFLPADAAPAAPPAPLVELDDVDDPGALDVEELAELGPLLQPAMATTGMVSATNHQRLFCVFMETSSIVGLLGQAPVIT
jgi:hypothetical protein